MKLAEAAQLQRHGIDPYNGAIGRKLILSVVGIHAALIPFLCLLTWFDEEKMKREEVPPITKEVVIPIVMNLPAENPQQPTDTPPAGDPQPVQQPEKRERKDLGPLPPIEPLPDLPPPPPKQKPKPKPQPQQVKPEPQPQKPKPQPQQQKPKPQPQPQKPKPQPQKPKPQPQKPKPQQPSIEDRIRAQREKNKGQTVTRPRETDAERKAREKAAREKAAKERAAREAAEKAARDRAQALAEYRKGLQGVDSSGVDGILADSKDREYLGKLKAFVEPRFRQPSDAQLNGRKPHTVVSVSIAADGHVLDWQITQASGIAAMDDAVRTTMRSLKVVPAPPRAMKIPLTFQAK